MRCTCPILIRRKDGYVQEVPCGQCINCRLNRARMWSIRIMHEARLYKDNVFLTLTYDDEHLPDNLGLCKEDLTLFIKRMRKVLSFRYFACGEYGEDGKVYGRGFGRPHFHIILFGVSMHNTELFSLTRKVKNGYYAICRFWNKGFAHVGEVTIDSGNYVAGYVVKKQTGPKANIYKEQGVISPYIVMSRRPGIGYQYLQDHMQELETKGYVFAKGFKYPLPRFYADRLDDKSSRFVKAKELQEEFEKEIEQGALENNVSRGVRFQDICDGLLSRTKSKLKMKERKL